MTSAVTVWSSSSIVDGMAGADLKKVKAAAANRSKKSGLDWRLQYGLWIGGMAGSIVLAMLSMLVSPTKGPFQILVNEPSLIAHFQLNAKTWKSGASAYFEDWTIGDVKTVEGINILQGRAPCVVPETPTPESFDLRS
ncbi:unnamed protein product, partial [Polarella glacialis]